MKSSLGSGILAMPLAFKSAGFIMGVVGTLIIGFICTYCSHILVKITVMKKMECAHNFIKLQLMFHLQKVKMSQELCRIEKKPSLDYGDVCEKIVANGPKKIRKYSRAARYLPTCIWKS